MISGEELSFVRLAMRKRLVQANQVREAVERKKWDTPDNSLRSILVEMGVLKNDQVVALNDELRSGGGRRANKARKPHTTMIGKDDHAQDGEEDLDRSTVPSVLGGYKLEKLLGAGAMGAVYLAKHQELRRTVALKLLLTEGAPSPRAIQRFKREARLAARLDHPNVVRVYESGQDKGYHYIAMDVVRGSSVAELITLGEMSPRRAVHVMRKTCEAVAYAHEQDVIHRDLKPANILVDEATGEARVTDFGLATLAEADEDDRLTRTGAAVGTPAYMAPEQVRGQLKQIDRRTDVYSLGATFYEMLTSQPPFESPTFLELAKKICDEPPTSPRKRNKDVPLDVETICLKALEKSKDDRYTTAADMAADLAAYLRDQEIVAQRPSAWVLLGRWLKRHPGLVTVIVAVLTVLVGTGAFYLSLPGYLEITTNPAGAEVLVDGKSVGTTSEEPIKVELSAGVHDLKFKLSGYQERALGIPSVTVGHGSTHQIAGSLVSSKGLLRILTTPLDARVRVYAGGKQEVLVEGRTPFLESLPAGDYDVDVEKAGFQVLARRRVVLTAGGAESKVSETLTPFTAEVKVVADPADVSLDWSRDDRAYASPASFRGEGEHRIEGTKSGYLPRVLKVAVEPDERLSRRLTLAPLLAFRRPLDGELLAGPLVDDVDADGAADLIVIVRGVGGNRLAVHPGRGRTRAQFSVRTTADTLVGLHDINADGTLDVVCGNKARLEVRDGRQGRLIMNLGLNAGSVGLSHSSSPPRLVYGAAADHPLTTGLSVTSLTVRVSRRPAFLTQGGRTLAAYAGSKSILLQQVNSKQPAARLRVPALGRVGWAARLHAVSVIPDRDPWLVAVPPVGPALVINPLRGKSYSVGAAGARYTHVQAVEFDQGTWLFLSDAARQGRVTAYSLSAGFAKAEEALSGLGMGVAVERGKRPRVWTASGTALGYGPNGWEVDRSRSTSAEAWLPRDASLTTADLTGDGSPEVIAPSADRRSLVVIDPNGAWLRWRVRAPGNGALVPARLRPAHTDLIVVDQRRLVVLAGDDGRERSSLELPGKVLQVVPSTPVGGQASDIYVLFEDEKGRGLLRYSPDEAGALKSAWPSAVRRPIAALAPLPVDLDKDRANDVLMSAPLALLGSGSGKERWSDDRDHSKTLGIDPREIGPPVFIGTICIGPSYSKGSFALVAHDQTGTQLWLTPFERKVYDPSEKVRITHPEPVRHVLGAATASHCAVVTDERLVFLKLGSGTPTRKQRADQIALKASDPLIGGVMVGGDRPALVVVSRSGLRAYDPDAKGSDAGIIWEEQLPAGSQPSSTPILVPQPKGPPAVALVTPTGVLAFYDPVDGVFLGERRYPAGTFRPGVLLLPGPTPEAPGALVLRTSDGRIVALEQPRLKRPRSFLRMRVKALRQQLKRPAGKVQALVELSALVQEDPQPFALLTLAQGHLEGGRPDEALRAIDQVLEREARSVEALRLKARATYARDQSLTKVKPVLIRLKAIDGVRAAQVALELAASSRPVDEKQLYRAAVTFHPQDGRARRLLGLHMLRSAFPIPAGQAPKTKMVEWIRVGKQWWKSRKPEELLEARRIMTGVRLTLMQSLANEDHPDGRAGALLAAAVELAMTRELRARGSKRPIKLLERTIQGLIDSGPPPGFGSPLFEQVRRVAEMPTLSRGERFEALRKIFLLRQDWQMPLLALMTLGHE